MTTVLDTKDKIRLLISDVGGLDGSSFIFTDAEIEAFYEMMGGESVMLAASLALRTIANNEAMTQKKIVFLELETDGPALAKAQEAMANKLESLGEEEFEFELAQMGVDVFSRRQIRMQVANAEGGYGTEAE